MLIKKIEFTQFMGWVGENWVHDTRELTLPLTGITLISGPNGAGKSGFAEGVAALWNRSLRKQKSRRTRGFRKGVVGRVRVTTVDGLVVDRGCTKSGTLKLEYARIGTPPANYATPTKALEALETEIGTYDLWRRACVFSAADASGFTAATDADRRALVEELLDLEQFAQAHEIGKAKHKKFLAEFNKLETETDVRETRLLGVCSIVGALQDNLANNPKPDPLPIDTIPHDRQEVHRLDVSILGLNGCRDNAHKRAMATQKIVQAEAVLAGIGSPPGDREAADLTELRAEWERLEGEVTKGEEAVQEKDGAWRQLLKEETTARSDLHHEAKRHKALAGGKCPTCERGISEEMRVVLTVMVETISKKVEFAEGSVTTTGAELKVLKAHLVDLRKLQADVRVAGIQEAAEAKAYEGSVQTWEASKLRAVQALAAAREEYPEELVGEFGDAERERLEKEIAERERLRAAITTAEAEARAHKTQVETWSRNDTKWRGDLTKAEGEVVRLETEEETALQEMDQMQEDVSVAAAGVAMLAPKGVRAHILQRALDAIQTIANRWLREFHDSLLIELSPYSEKAAGGTKMSIALKIQGREEGEEYEDLSGGERRRLDLAMVLALAEVARLAQGVAEWGTLFLDEILDAVDPEGAERVCDAIRRLSADRSVVVISHNRAIRDRLQPVQEIRLG